MVKLRCYNLETGHCEVLEQWKGDDVSPAVEWIITLLAQQPHDRECLYWDVTPEE